MDIIKPKGFIEARIKYKNTNTVKTIKFNNQVLNGGKRFLAKCLLEDSTSIHVAYMLFGDGGTINRQPKEILPSQDKLSGVIRVKKPVIAQLDSDILAQVIFSVMIDDNEGNEFPLNEMGLELSDGTLFSLSTFADLNKTDQMEISWSWFVLVV
jgi:hypothetical protein